jgi:hypothetical protein
MQRYVSDDARILLTHIAIQEAHDGKLVEWVEKVTDQQYVK